MTVAVDKARTIGGSDVAGILGISPFRTPLDVWREKVLGQRDEVDTPATRAGTRFERHILNAYRSRLPDGARLWTPPALVDGYRRCTVDAIAEVRRLTMPTNLDLGRECSRLAAKLREAQAGWRSRLGGERRDAVEVAGLHAGANIVAAVLANFACDLGVPLRESFGIETCGTAQNVREVAADGRA